MTLEEKIKSKYPNLDILTKNINSRDKIKFQCKDCDSILCKRIDNILINGCNLCSKSKILYKNYMIYLNNLIENNIKFRPIEKYKGSNIKINHQCLDCGFIRKILPNALLQSNKFICNGCVSNKMESKFRKNGFLLIKDEYMNPIRDKYKYKIQCLICSNTSYSSNNIRSCKYCNEENYKNEYKNFVMNNTKYSLIDEYRGCETKINHKCEKGHIFACSPSNIKHGKGCPKCKGGIKFNNLQYLNKLQENNIRFLNLDEYDGIFKKIDHQCLDCDKIVNISPKNILDGSKCTCKSGSIGESIIISFLEKNKINYIYQYSFDDLRSDKNIRLRFDFKIEKDNNYLLLEFQGEQHFKYVEFIHNNYENYLKQCHHDNMKIQYCIDKKIQLIHIKWNENILEKLNNFF
jgi:hypothetical protein